MFIVSVELGDDYETHKKVLPECESECSDCAQEKVLKRLQAI